MQISKKNQIHIEDNILFKLKITSEYFLFKPNDIDVLQYVESKCQDDSTLKLSVLKTIQTLIEKLKDEPFPQKVNYGYLSDKLKDILKKQIKDFKTDR